jgi:single-strand DNA-binding protein
MEKEPSHSAHVHKNECHISGELSKDPDIRFTPQAKCLARLTVETKYGKQSQFHRVTAWEELAEKVSRLKVGAFVQVVGRLQTRSWVDKSSGEKKYSTEVVAFRVEIPEHAPAPLTPDQVGADDIPW